MSAVTSPSTYSDLPERVAESPDLHLSEVKVHRTPSYAPELQLWNDPKMSPSSKGDWDTHRIDINQHHNLRPDDGSPAKRQSTSRISRKRWITAFVIAVVLALGIGLGAGLGIGLNQRKATSAEDINLTDPAIGDNNSTNQVPIEVMRNTGLATVTRSDGQGILLYYQLRNGTLVEHAYSGTNLSAAALNASPLSGQRKVIDATDITDRSALAVTTFPDGKYLFYVNRANRIISAVDRGSGWGNPFAFSPERRFLNAASPYPAVMEPESLALAACYFGGVGVRVYHGIAGAAGLTGVGQVAKTEILTAGPYADNTFRTWTVFEADALAGFSCSGQFSNGTGLKQDVYMRGNESDIWYVREGTATSPAVYEPSLQDKIGDRSPIAAATNANADRALVFFRGVDGEMKFLRFLLPGRRDSILTSTGIRLGPSAKIAAIWPNADGALVFYEGAPGRIHATMFDESGEIVANTTIVG